jgi:hypothetical protein
MDGVARSSGCPRRSLPISQGLPPCAPLSQSDPWVGRWTGPEGTFLEVAASAGGYQLTLHNLDGPRQFQGKPVGDAIVFERNGVPEAIRKGTGAQTGMKWLAEKSDCLVVGPGEGYCRG